MTGTMPGFHFLKFLPFFSLFLVRFPPKARSERRGTRPPVPRPDAIDAPARAEEGKGGVAGTGATRTHAQPPLGGEHGEDGEDPPLAWSEHVGSLAVFG